MPPSPNPRKRSPWRLVTRFFGRIWGNPILMLAIVVAIIAFANYRTLMAGLPSSLPELTTWWAERDPVLVTVNGAVSDTDLCWQMRFTFLDAAGDPILDEKDYAARIGTATPSREIALPALGTYVIRTAVELTNADPASACVAIAGIAVMRAKTYDITLTDFAERATINNRCAATDVGLECAVEIE